MIQDDQILKETVGQRNAFKVPDGYFEQLTSQVMNQLPEKKARTMMLRGWMYAAACSVAALLLGVTYYMHHQDTQKEMVAESNYIEEVADYAMIDNMDIYACLSDE